MGWADTEFETIDLGDARRNKRAIRLVECLSAQPTASVSQACGDWADTMTAYRFFDNEEVDWCAILGAHTGCAKTRMAQRGGTSGRAARRLFGEYGRWRTGYENHLAGHAAHPGLCCWRQVLTRASGVRELCTTKCA